MLRLFKQPYPINDSPGRELRKAILIGLFVGLFLLAFQPFGINLWDTPHKVLKIAGFGAVTSVVTAFNFIVWQRLFPRLFREEKWTVGHEIGFITGNVLLIAIANRVYLGLLLEPGEKSNLHWLGMILVTFLVALFPVTALVLLNYITQLKKYSQAAAALPVHSVNPTGLPDHNSLPEQATALSAPIITLVADNEKDTVTFLPADLLFIESSDNYATVVYLKNGQPVKPLLRSSLSRLEKQITKAHIVRCHRSYVVNLDRVEYVTGNAQGYKLHLLKGQFQIPVARQYNETLVAELKAL